MKPCASRGCPALATKGEYCPVHAWRGKVDELLEGPPAAPRDSLLEFKSGQEWAQYQTYVRTKTQRALIEYEPVSEQEIRRAAEKRDRIGRMYRGPR